MIEVIWRPEALEQLDVIADHIEKSNAVAADRMRRRLRALGDSLGSAPDRGRPSAGGTRQLVVVRPYVLTYQLAEDRVYILRIRHSARRPVAG